MRLKLEGLGVHVEDMWLSCDVHVIHVYVYKCIFAQL